MLTKRQLQVLAGVRDGHTAEVVAKNLGLSPETVREHLKTARRKLGANNATHAVIMAIRLDLLPLEEANDVVE